MEAFFVLLGLAVLAIPIAVIGLLVGHSRLRRRVEELENRLASLDATGTALPAAAPPQPILEPEPEPPAEPPDLSEPATPEGASEPERAEPVASPWPSLGRTDLPAEPPGPPPGEAVPEAVPQAVVFRRDTMDRAVAWLSENWFLAIAALSLALAGVFLVQYGVERGLLTPFWRVMGAVALGVALIWAAEVIRRRAGDDADSHTAYLPSTFAGAGLVVLFAAALAARQLYGLIGPEIALAALLAVSALAVVLGWFYGPFLAITGILGATAAPFLVGGSSDSPQIYFYYFALIALAGLLVDTVHRWAWVSVFALIFTHGAAWLIFAGEAGDVHYLAFALITAAAAAAIPPRQWTPAHGAPTVLEAALRRGATGWPEFPARVAAGAFVAACAVVGFVTLKDTGPVEAWACVLALSALYLAAVVWMRGAPGLTDLALLPSAGLVAFLIWQGDTGGSLFTAFAAPRPPETPPTWDVTVLSGIALAGSVLAFWRSRIGAPFALVWAAGAALFAPAALTALEIFWQPATVIDPGPWGGHALAAAAAMVVMAERSARADAPEKHRAAIFALSALSLISFALMVMLSDVALTLSLGVMVLLAALIDRWQKMPALSVFIQVAAAVIAYRLIFDPGLDWAETAPMWELWLAFGGTILLLSAAWVVMRGLDRPAGKLVVESAVWTVAAVFASTLIYRWLGAEPDTHWGMSLLALVWIAAMAGQLWRLQAGGPLRWVRIGLAVLFGLLATVLLLVSVFGLNPLMWSSEPVRGPFVFDSLFVAYALPGLALALIAWRQAHLNRWLRLGFAILGGALGAMYLALEIRRFWRGDILAVPGTTDPELYSYTVAMLIVSVGFLFWAFALRSVALRRVAMLGIALTIAKVFLVDMSGLAGLVRVASFLGLGLSLAGLAWVNRRMTEQWDKGDDPSEDAGDA